MRLPGCAEVLGEIDAAATADGCALIAKVKATLTPDTFYQLSCLLDTIRWVISSYAALFTMAVR